MEPKYPADLQNVVTLLEKLGKVEAKYPVELLAQRRVAFLDKVSAVKVNVHLKGGKGQGGLPSSGAEMLLQSFLVIILVAEIAIGAYVLRDKWLPLLRHSTPTPAHSVPLPTSAFAPITTPLASPTILPTGTIVPTIIVVPIETNIPNIQPTDSNPNLVVPEKTKKGNPGKHLGQTPEPPETPSKDKGH